MPVIITLLMALFLVGCASTNSGCAGFAKLHPSSKTRDYIVKNDPPFAGEVAGHNKFGSSRNCW